LQLVLSLITDAPLPTGTPPTAVPPTSERKRR